MAQFLFCARLTSTELVFLNFLVVQTMLSALLQAMVADLKDNLRYAVRKLKP
ncbi:hypothetical protein [Parasutterella excrementihominis]|uniref:hypothetical protein n=1 Tax=Parasutterella excrementihominis TaxID=487175 RepID=UPI003AB61540